MTANYTADVAKEMKTPDAAGPSHGPRVHESMEDDLCLVDMIRDPWTIDGDNAQPGEYPRMRPGVEVILPDPKQKGYEFDEEQKATAFNPNVIEWHHKVTMALDEAQARLEASLTQQDGEEPATEAEGQEVLRGQEILAEKKRKIQEILEEKQQQAETALQQQQEEAEKWLEEQRNME